jgi:DNA-binding NarL/FixJ family response regulator
VPNAEAALRAVHEHRPDVVVMDLNMPGTSGLEATARLTADGSATRVLMLTVSAQESDVTDAIVAGASGYVLKESPVEEVVAGIRAAATGQAYVSPRVATLVFQRLQEAERGVDAATVPLSARER